MSYTSYVIGGLIRLPTILIPVKSWC